MGSLGRRTAAGGLLTAVAAAMLLGGCTPTTTIDHGDHPADTHLKPPPFLVRFGGTQLELVAHTYCYHSATQGICADGFDADPPLVGSPAELHVFVPVPGMTQLEVSQSVGKGDCTRRVDARVTALGDGWWSVRPQGPAADYLVTLFAGGDGAGDMVADLRWRTPAGVAVPVTTDGPCSTGATPAGR